MIEIDLRKLEEAAERVCIKALTMLPPAAAMAIECMSELTGGEPGKRLTEIYEAFLDAGINKTPVCNKTDELLLIAQIGLDACADGDAERALMRGCVRALASLGINPNPPCRVLIEQAEEGGRRLLARPVCRLASETAVIIQLSGEGSAEIAELIAGEVSGKTEACPPLIIALGFGGTPEGAEALSQSALTRAVDTPSPNPECADIERLAKKALGSPGGFRPLAVLAEGGAEKAQYCAVTTGCWCTRYARVSL